MATGPPGYQACGASDAQDQTWAMFRGRTGTEREGRRTERRRAGSSAGRRRQDRADQRGGRRAGAQAARRSLRTRGVGPETQGTPWPGPGARTAPITTGARHRLYDGPEGWRHENEDHPHRMDGDRITARFTACRWQGLPARALAHVRGKGVARPLRFCVLCTLRCETRTGARA